MEGKILHKSLVSYKRKTFSYKSMLKIAVRCSQSLFLARFFSPRPPFFCDGLCYDLASRWSLKDRTCKQNGDGTRARGPVCVNSASQSRCLPAAVRTVWEKPANSSPGLLTAPSPPHTPPHHGKQPEPLLLPASPKHHAIPPPGPRGRLHSPVPPISSSGFLPWLGFLWRTCN